MIIKNSLQKNTVVMITASLIFTLSIYLLIGYFTRIETNELIEKINNTQDIEQEIDKNVEVANKQYLFLESVIESLIDPHNSADENEEFISMRLNYEKQISENLDTIRMLDDGRIFEPKIDQIENLLLTLADTADIKIKDDEALTLDTYRVHMARLHRIERGLEGQFHDLHDLSHVQMKAAMERIEERSLDFRRISALFLVLFVVLQLIFYIIIYRRIRDIENEKARYLKDLEQKNEEYEILAEHNYDWEYWLLPDGTFKYISPACQRITGYTPKEIIADKTLLFNMVSDEDRETVMHHYSSVSETDRCHPLLYRMKNKDGDMIWIEHRCRAIRSKTGHYLGRRGINIDVTKKRNAEDRFTIAFKSSPDAVNINRMQDGLYIEINEGFTHLTGYTNEDVKGKTSADINIWYDMNDRQRLVEGLQKNGFVNNLEARFVCKDGHVTTALMSAKMIDLNGEICILSITRDIQEIKDAEEEKTYLLNQLQQSQKLESMGQLAGGIAHDFNNILTALYGFTELAMKDAALGDRTLRLLEQIRQGHQKAANLVRQILTFSRKEKIEPIPVELNTLIEDFGKMLKRVVEDDIDLSLDMFNEPIYLFADPGQLEQIIMNLVVNARDAFRKSEHINRNKTIIITTGKKTYHGRKTGPLFSISTGDYAQISVRDNGEGIAAEIQDKIYEPFFTTKEKGAGTGLGLSTVYGIIKQNHGYIDLISNESKGTEFIISWPVLKNSGRSEDTGWNENSSDLMGKGERILVVEDEITVRELIKSILEESNYSVAEAQNGLAALDVIENPDEHFDLVLSDITMPKMSGFELFQILRENYPELPVILITGYFENAEQLETIKPAVTVINKPFEQQELLLKISELLHP